MKNYVYSLCFSALLLFTSVIANETNPAQPLSSPTPWLKTRNDLYTFLPSSGIVAEVGVSFGGNAKMILSKAQPRELFLIDNWSYCDHDDAQYSRVLETFKDQENVHIVRKLSKDAAQQFEDNYFDWVYIDAAHDEVSVKQDLEAWYPKVKPGGYITGHDYAGKTGVTLAVNKFLNEHGLSLTFLTYQDDTIGHHPGRYFESFAIQKPTSP